MRLRTILLATLVSLLATGAQAQLRDFRDWLAICDNLRNCSAYGFESDIGSGAYLRIERLGAPDAPAKVTIAVYAPEKTTTATLAFDDAALPGLPQGQQAGARNDDDDFARIVLTGPAEVASFIASARKAQKIVVTRVDAPGAPKSDRDKSEISLSGAAASLLWIDAQQKRLGTVTALIDRGDKPASVVPPQPSAPAVVAAKPVAAPVSKTIPKAVLREAKNQCTDDEGERETDEIYRLTDKLTLYMFVCQSGSGAYNFETNLLTSSSDRPNEARTLNLTMPKSLAGNGGDADTTNAAFDPATMTLTTFTKDRGIGDCGSQSVFAFDGRAFRLVAIKAMPECKGVPLSDWQSIYSAIRK